MSYAEKKEKGKLLLDIFFFAFGLSRVRLFAFVRQSRRAGDGGGDGHFWILEAEAGFGEESHFSWQEPDQNS